MTFSELESKLLELMPNAEFDENEFGELIVKSGLHEDLDGVLHPVLDSYPDLY